MKLLRVLAVLITLVALSGGDANLVQAQGMFSREAEMTTVPEGVRVTLETDRSTYFLGENIVAHFGVENTGTQPFKINSGGDYRGAARATRFVVSAQDESGESVRDPYPFNYNFGGLIGDQTLKPGEKWFQTLSLNRYCRFESPGKYRVRVQHDLGWRATPDHPLPVAEAQIQLVMPSPEQAKAIIAATEAMPPNPGVLIGHKNLYPHPDFSTLSYPVYLPFLLERIDAGKLDFLQAVEGIETPEATQALIARLQAKPPTAQAMAQILVERMPLALSPTEPVPTSQGAAEALKQRRHRVEASWREAFNAPIRAYARKAVQSNDRETLRTAAAMLESVGSADDLRLVLVALDRRIEMTVRTPRWQTTLAAAPEGIGDDGDGWSLQDDCLALIRCGHALLQRGAVLPSESAFPTGTLGVIALRINSEPKSGKQQSNKQPIPEQWTPTYAKWLRHPVPFIRQLALESLIRSSYKPSASGVALAPQLRSLLPVLLQDPDISVRDAACDLAGESRDHSLLPAVLGTLTTANNSWLVGSADHAAEMLGGRYAAWTIWAARLDEPGMLRPAIEALSKVVGGGSGYGWNGRSSPGIGRVLKPKWQKFLAANQVRLQQGKLFSLNETAWPKDLFPPEFLISR